MTTAPPLLLPSIVARRIASNDLHAQVGGCRDRFLREAAERRLLDSGRVGHVATQTDATTSAGGWHNGDDHCAPSVSGRWPGGASRELDLTVPAAWSKADEEEQAEAVQAIQLLSSRSCGPSRLERQVARLEDELLGVYAQLKDEGALRAAAQEQVRCLEHELDGKEACLQAMTSALEQRNAELQQAQSQLSASQAKVAEPAPSTAEPHIKLIEAKVQAQEFQLQLKEQHISRLMSVLRHHHSFHGEADSTTCGSEDAMAMSTATGATGP